MNDTLVMLLDGRPSTPDEMRAADPRRRVPIPLGIYETVLVVRDRAALSAPHARRHARAAADLGLVAPAAEEIERELQTVAASSDGRRCRLRMLRWLDANRTRTLVTLDPEPPRPVAATVGVHAERRPSDARERRHKRIDAPDLDRARAAAREAGLIDLLILDEAGRVLEGSKTSVFWRRGRTVFTPSKDLPILPGVRRDRLLWTALRAGLEAREVEAPLETLLEADEILLTNAIVGVLRRVRLVV